MDHSRFNSLYDIFDIENHIWKYPDLDYDPAYDQSAPIPFATPFDPNNENHWDQHWDEHFGEDTASTDDIDLVGDQELRQLVDELPDGTFGDMHLCTRAMLTKPSTIHGCRFCKNCGILWPKEHLPLW